MVANTWVDVGNHACPRDPCPLPQGNVYYLDSPVSNSSSMHPSCLLSSVPGGPEMWLFPLLVTVGVLWHQCCWWGARLGESLFGRGKQATTGIPLTAPMHKSLRFCWECCPGRGVGSGQCWGVTTLASRGQCPLGPEGAQGSWGVLLRSCRPRALQTLATWRPPPVRCQSSHLPTCDERGAGCS